jgi:fido (protein-threonine AMPylation protein)
LVARIIQDHADALEGVFAFVKGERNLSVGYIRELHAALLANQETFTAVDQFGHAFEKEIHKGQYKALSNNPTRPDGTVHEYCPPEHVAAEMDRMVALHQTHNDRGVPVEVEAAWLHHVFAQIHPFEDGNGRVARAIASLVFIKAGWFPVLITRDTREKYIDALEVADQGDLRRLVALFVQSQRTSLLGAMEAALEVKPPSSVDEVITAALGLLIQRGLTTPRAWERAKEIVHQLWNTGTNRVSDISGLLKADIARLRSEFGFAARAGQGSLDADAATQVLNAARSLGYSANLDDFNDWTQLLLKNDGTSSLLLSFHGVGAKYRGIIGALVIFLEQGKEAVLATDEAFQINYAEDPTQAQVRFSKWLESALTRGLTLWRKTL